MKSIKLASLSALLTTTVLLSACSSRTASVDLDRVLDVTSQTLTSFEQEQAYNNYTENSELNADGTPVVKTTMNEESIKEFGKQLERNLNRAAPQIHPETIGVNMSEDGSIQGYNDKNNNGMKDSGEKELFKIEVDGEKQRLLASSGEYVRDHGFSGSGLLTGLLIGNMLSRQRGAGIRPSSLSSKRAVSKSAYKSARTRSGSGSHSRGK